MHATSPDFYMWSIYEDAPGWMKGSLLQAASEKGFKYLKGASDHLKKMQGSGIYKHNELLKTVGVGDELGRSDNVRNKHIQNIMSSADTNREGVSVNRVSGFGKLSHQPENSATTKTFIYDRGIVTTDDGITKWVPEIGGSGPLGGQLGHLENFKEFGATEHPFRDPTDTLYEGPAGQNIYVSNQSVDGMNASLSMNPETSGPNDKSTIMRRTGQAEYDVKTASHSNVQAFYKKKQGYYALKAETSEEGSPEKEMWQAAFNDAGAEYRAWGEMLSEQGFRIPPLSVTDGTTQYNQTMRASPATYKTLLTEKIRDVEAMFGSRAGYIGEYIRPGSKIASELEDTAIAALSDYRHAYDLDSLKDLAKQSAVDIISEKLSMKRAYPTFKLYFVEEDEMQSRWLNLDDFYSFNAVKEFTIHKSRKNAADTAIIVLQNIAGTLDGTKRDVIVDLDYLTQMRSKETAQKLRELRGKDQQVEGLRCRYI